MRKKWGPFIGGILIGLVIMAMNYKYVVNDDNLVYKNNLVYEKEIKAGEASVKRIDVEKDEITALEYYLANAPEEERV